MADPTPIKNDTSEGRKFIVNTLLSFDTIKNFVGTHPVNGMYQIFGDVALQNHTHPCILVQFVSASPINYYSRKIGNRIKFDIKLMSQGDSTAPNQDVLGLIEMAFQHAQLDDGDIVAGTRIVGGIEYSREIDGGIIEHCQGFMIEMFIYSQQANAIPNTEIWG